MSSEQPRVKVSPEEYNDAMRKGMDIAFTDSIFEFPISFRYNQKTSVQYSFTFKNCSFSKIEFQNAIFTRKVNFQSCQIANDFSINNCIFNGLFQGYHISAKRIAFWNNDFTTGFELYNFDQVGELILQFKQVSKKVTIQQWHVNPIELSNIHITFDNISESPIHIENLYARKIEIQLSGQHLTENLWIGDIKTLELKLINIKNKSDNKIEIVRVNAWKIYFLWLHNDGWLSLQEFNRYSIKEGSIFNVQKSYFGNAELYHIDLDSYERIEIFNCHLQNIIPVNVKWNFNLNAYKGIKAEYLRELFRQLKNVCANNMDKIGQLHFEKMEMLFYSSQLNWRKNFQDWFILKSNQISNNHGLSWGRALGWLLGLTFLFYTITNYVSGSFSCYHIGNYFAFLLPLHNIGDLLCLKLSDSPHKNWIYFWDINQRIISSYFIFQFLRAFRKFVN